MSHFGKKIIIGITALGFSMAVFAADADCRRQHDGTAPSAECAAKFAERIAQHHQRLHDKLKITPAQEGAWKTFTAKATPTAPPNRPSRDEAAKLSAPQRMEQMLGMMKEHEARMTERLAAVKEFYAVLTPAQQAIFNEEFQHMRHRGRHGFGRG